MIRWSRIVPFVGVGRFKRRQRCGASLPRVTPPRAAPSPDRAALAEARGLASAIEALRRDLASTRTLTVALRCRARRVGTFVRVGAMAMQGEVAKINGAARHGQPAKQNNDLLPDASRRAQ